MFKKLLSLLSDVAVYGISNMLSQLIGFLLLPVYTRYLTPEDQGLIAMILAVTAFFAPLANTGIGSAIFRRFNREKDETERGRVLSTGLISITASSLVVLAVSLVFAEPIARLAVGDAGAVNLVRVGLISMAASAIGLAPMAVLRAQRRVKITALINVSKLLLSVACTIWMVVVLQWGVWGVLAGSLVADVVFMVILFTITSRFFRYGFHFDIWRQLLDFGLPLVPHQFQLLGLGLLGQYTVGHMLGMREAGLYSVAIKLSMPIAFVVNSVANAWTPFKYEIHANDEDPAAFFRTSFTYYFAGVVYLWVGVCLWGPEVVWLMTDRSFHDAAWLVPVVGLIPISQGLASMIGTGMEVSDNMRPYPLVSLAGLIVALVGVVYLVPRLGGAGAAIGSAAAWMTMGLALYYFSQQRFRIHYDWSTLALLAVFASAGAAVGYVSLEWPLVPRLALAVLVSLAFPLIEFGVLSRSSTERHRMRILWNKVARRRRTATGTDSAGEAA